MVTQIGYENLCTLSWYNKINAFIVSFLKCGWFGIRYQLYSILISDHKISYSLIMLSIRLYLPTGFPPSHFVNFTETTSRLAASDFASPFRHRLTTLAATFEY